MRSPRSSSIGWPGTILVGLLIWIFGGSTGVMVKDDLREWGFPVPEEASITEEEAKELRAQLDEIEATLESLNSYTQAMSTNITLTQGTILGQLQLCGRPTRSK